MNLCGKSLPVLLVLGVTTVALSGCGSRVFETSYAAPVSVDVSKTWHVADVVVSLPKKLTVSEEHVYEPKADIVWREDPMGDRRPQVAAIMKEAISRGAKGLHGGRAVRMEATLIRFHALTFETESLNLAGIGVHNIDFTLRVVDAHSGEVLAGPDTIDASLPALTGTEMIKARLRGESQKSQIEAHVAATIAGWLGTGPDQRDSFVRIGG